MSPTGIVLLAIISVASGAAMAFFLVWLVKPRDQGSIGPATSGLAPIPEAEQVVESGARVFDPDNPPRYATYNPKHYDPDRAMRCTCHQRRIEQGDKVLLWPIPDHPEGGMDIFCKDTYGETGVPR